ncbi:hypothetical protein H5410_002232 [Solanum commersonii]|uniref:Uncharacterized protein n=1 Tax=Solanum commersonii TaxID=4109 RepID=A0A9J6B1S0_SOLCO|nr:hypothetical protein H5410_002232 [Solanum commersonii]
MKPSKSQCPSPLMDDQQITGSSNRYEKLQTRDETCNVFFGTYISFWEENWIGHGPLKQIYPDIYNLCQQHDATVAELWSEQGRSIPSFKVTTGDKSGMAKE